MKKLVLASATILSFASVSQATLDTVNKSGFYVGVNGGYGFGKDMIQEDSKHHLRMRGPIGGAHLGYQHDLGRFVVGLELGADLPKMHKKFKFDGVSAKNAGWTAKEREEAAREYERRVVTFRAQSEETAHRKSMAEHYRSSGGTEKAELSRLEKEHQDAKAKYKSMEKDLEKREKELSDRKIIDSTDSSSDKGTEIYSEGKLVRKNDYTAALRFGYKIAPCWVAGISLGYVYAQHHLKGTLYTKDKGAKTAKAVATLNEKFKNHGFVPGVYVEKLLQKHVMVGLGYNYGFFKKHKSKKSGVTIRPQTHDIKVRLGYKF